MLEPEYFSDKADRMIEIYQELEDFIFKDIAGRLLESQSVSGTADRLIWKLEQMGESRAEIMKKLSQLTRLSRRELQAILQDAVMTSWKDDLDTFNVLGKNIANPLDNDVVRAVMDAEYRKSQGELHNLTRTTMNKANQDLIRMLDEVDVRVASGVQSYSAAVCDILDNYAGKGFEIEYPSGTKRTLEAAVRMCVVTSMNQTSAQITNQYIVEGGIEYVLVSAHVGARPQQKGQPYLSGHENWQGKAYRIRGSEPGFPNLAEMTGYDIDAQGNGKVVDPRGLHGYNCRHSHKPWDKRLRNPYVDENGNPKIDTEKNRKLYEAQQKQRAMERAVRKTKRELLMKQEEINRVAETDVKEMLQSGYDRLAHKLHQQNEAYNKFCEEKGLQRQSDRLKIVGFKRKQAAQARGRARAYQNNEAVYAGVPKEWENAGHPLVSLKAINPTGSMENCANCIAAYEMRQRGFKVIANEMANKTLLRAPWKAWKDVEVIEEYGKSDILELVKATKGNCRYGIAFTYEQQRGHCVVLEKYQDTISIIDAQSGERYSFEEYKIPEDGIKAWKLMENGETAELSDVGGKVCKKV